MKKSIHVVLIATMFLISFSVALPTRAINKSCTSPTTYSFSFSVPDTGRYDQVVPIYGRFSWNIRTAPTCLNTPISFHVDYQDKDSHWQTLNHSDPKTLGEDDQIEITMRRSLQSMNLAELRDGAYVNFRTEVVDADAICITNCVIVSSARSMVIDSSASLPPKKTYSCNSAKQCVANDRGTYTTSNCDDKCGGGSPGGGLPPASGTYHLECVNQTCTRINSPGSTATQCLGPLGHEGGACTTNVGGGATPPGGTTTSSGKFVIDNPIGASDFGQLVNLIAKWILNLAIPIAVIFIIYAGLRMILAQGRPEEFKKGRDILKYAVIGLAVILIGKGFVSLIQSILSLGK